jgi:hypothetical protein
LNAEFVWPSPQAGGWQLAEPALAPLHDDESMPVVVSHCSPEAMLT